ncbi:hypothetical protein ACVI1T_000585 [Rhizobium redzepovicii]
MDDESDHGFWLHYASLSTWCICRNLDRGAVERRVGGHPIHWKSKTQSGITTYKPDGTIEATADGTRPLTRAHGASKATRCARSSIRKNARRSIRFGGRNTPRGRNAYGGIAAVLIFVARRHVNRLASRASPRPKLAKARIAAQQVQPGPPVFPRLWPRYDNRRSGSLRRARRLEAPPRLCAERCVRSLPVTLIRPESRPVARLRSVSAGG